MSQGIHPRVWSAAVVLGLLVALAAPLSAVAGTSPAGEWTGKMKTPDGQEVEILLTLNQEGAVWSGLLESDFIGETTVSGLKVTDTRISFTFKPEGAPFPAHFSGSYIAGDDRVTGTFSLRGNSRFVKFNRVPGSETVALPPGEEPAAPARIRHDYRFAVTARASFWAAIHVVKDEVYKINNTTIDDWAFDGTLRYFVLDGFNIFARGYKGSQRTTTDETKLVKYEDIGLISQSKWEMQGWEIGMMGYLGNVMMRNSKFNPYLTAAVGEADWKVIQNHEKGDDVIVLDEHSLEGKDFAVSAGFGTEYELGKRWQLEFEWLWRYFMTEDEEKWEDTDGTWSNTHVWSLSFGVTYGFW